MTIKEGTRIGRRGGPEVDGVQGYDWFTYCTNELANIVQSGNHKPTIEQMLAAGCMIVIPVEYDSATHKLVPNSFNDNGLEIKQNTVALTPEETSTRYEDEINSLMQVMEDKLDTMVDDIANAKGYGKTTMSPTASCLSYAGYDNAHRANAEIFGQWIASLWPVAYQIQADFLYGLIPQPTEAEVLAAMPPMVWPVI